MPQPFDQPYAVLQLKPGATMDEVRLAYRHLARQWNPERFATDPAKQHEARARSQQIHEAYAAICEAAGETPAARENHSAPRSPLRWVVPIGMAAAVLLVLAAVVFPPMPAPVESPRETSARPADVPATTAAADAAPAAGTAVLTPLPWNVAVEPPSAPLADVLPPASAPRPTESDVRLIWVPATTNAAATGMSWSLNSPGLRPRAVPPPSGGAKTP